MKLPKLTAEQSLYSPVGRFYGVFTIRLRSLVGPLFGRGPSAVEEISRENPIELLDRSGLCEGELAMYAAYGVASPFLPAFVNSRGIAPEELGLVLGTATALRLISAPVAGRIGDAFEALRSMTTTSWWPTDISPPRPVRTRPAR